MAQRTRVVFTDDIDSSPAGTTISFAVDGTASEIDLNAAQSLAGKNPNNAGVHALIAGSEMRAGQASARGGLPALGQRWNVCGRAFGPT